MALRVSTGIALLFLGSRHLRWGGGPVPRPGRLYPWKDAVSILQEAGWAPGPVWMGGKSRPHRDSVPDRPVRSSVAIPTELPDPLSLHYIFLVINQLNAQNLLL